jgi:hypothetical protein
MKQPEFISLLPENQAFEETQFDIDSEDYEHLEIHSRTWPRSKRTATKLEMLHRGRGMYYCSAGN